MERFKIVKEYTAIIKDIDKKEMTITALVSTSEKDRASEYIPAEEWKLANYEKNPVILWAHNYDQPPVGKALWTKIDKKGLIQKIKFANTDFAKDIFGLYDGGFLNAFSVGFMSDRDAEDSSIFRNAELLEVSCVPVPCNANALMERAASGFIKSPEALAFVKSITPIVEVVKDPPAVVAPIIPEAKTKFYDDILKELDLMKHENEALIMELKEGRVLSTKNRTIIQQAVDVLQELLSATDPNVESAAAPDRQKLLDKTEKFVIISDKNKKDAPIKQGISANDITEAIKKVNVSEIVRGEIMRIKGEVK